METLLSECITITNDIYTTLGPGYNEIVYHRAFEVGLRVKGISYESEVVTPILYKEHTVGHGRVDLIVNKMVIIELKAIANLNTPESVIQIKNYMKQHSIPNGLVINFGQCNLKNPGSVCIKYINGNNNEVYTFTHGSFVLETLTI
jgi:GxxExxY protein